MVAPGPAGVGGRETRGLGAGDRTLTPGGTPVRIKADYTCKVIQLDAESSDWWGIVVGREYLCRKGALL